MFNPRFKSSLLLYISFLLFIANCSKDTSFTGKVAKLTDDGSDQDQNNLQISDDEVTLHPQMVAGTFAASHIQDGGNRITLSAKKIVQHYELASRYGSFSEDFTQGIRTKIRQNLKQGSRGVIKTENFVQYSNDVLDLVIVVDNSISMAEEQKNLAEKLNGLLQYIGNADWRINIVTTDPLDGCSIVLIKKGDSDIDQKFRRGILAGTGGANSEQGVRMAVEGLTCPGMDWVRPDSFVAVLILSDEDNCSYKGLDCEAPYNSPEFLLDHIKGQMGRVPGKQAKAYGIIWQPGTSCSGAWHQSIQYAQLIAKTGGKSGSICDADYGPTLRAISKDVAEMMQSEYLLAQIPDPGSIQVKINGNLRDSGFRVNGKTLVFEIPPPRGATIEVNYSYGAAPLLTHFPLREIPSSLENRVLINGVLLSPLEYKIDPTSRVLVLNQEPPFDAAIDVEFITANSLFSELKLGNIGLKTNVMITVNNNLIYDYKVTGDNRIVFARPPDEGASIQVSYQQKQEPILDFPFEGAPNWPYEELLRQIKIVDTATGKPIKGKIIDKFIRISPEEHQDGRKITASLDREGPENFVIAIPQRMLPDSLEVSPEQGECEYEVSQDKVELACEGLEGSLVDVKWQVRSEVQKTFTLPGIKLPDQGVWTVKIDGQPTTGFLRTESTVTLIDEIDQEAAVTLEFKPQ